MAQVLKNSGFVQIKGVAQSKPNQVSSFVEENFDSAEKPQSADSRRVVHPSANAVLKAGQSSDFQGGRTILRQGAKSKPVEFKDEQFAFSGESELPEIEMIDEIPAKTREEAELEAEMIKQTYINEGVQAKNEAKAWADKMVSSAKQDIAGLYEKAKADSERIKEDAQKEGYEAGYESGEQKGYEEGYNKGLRKCKETMKELVALLEEIPQVMEQTYRKHENQLFDCIFTISNKIMADSLKQKDKAVISKMLKAAAKGFRNSEYVKITLSKLDVDEMVTSEMDVLRKIFKDSQHIEFEVVKDAPSGTLILDNGSEITDAGIATQLKMIENLGKGKFRDLDWEQKE